MIRKAFASLIAWLCRRDGEAVYAEEIADIPPVTYCDSVRVLPAWPEAVDSQRREAEVCGLCVRTPGPARVARPVAGEESGVLEQLRGKGNLMKLTAVAERPKPEDFSHKDKADVLDWVLAVILVPFALLLKGYVVQLLWGWFAMPAFGVTTPPLMICVGLVVLGTYVTFRSSGKPKEGESPTANVLASAVLSVVVLATGYGIHLLA